MAAEDIKQQKVCTLHLPKTSMNVCFDKEGPARAAGTLCIGGYPRPFWWPVFRIITHGQLIALSIYVENITEQTHPLTRQERSSLSLTPDLSLLVSLLLSVPSYFPLPSPIHLTRPRSQFFGSTLIAFLQRKKKTKSEDDGQSTPKVQECRKYCPEKLFTARPTIKDRQTSQS